MIKARFYNYFPQNYDFSDALSLRCTRTTFRLVNFTRFSHVKICKISLFTGGPFSDKILCV